MKRKQLTKTFMMISNFKKLFFLLFVQKSFSTLRVRHTLRVDILVITPSPDGHNRQTIYKTRSLCFYSFPFFVAGIAHRQSIHRCLVIHYLCLIVEHIPAISWFSVGLTITTLKYFHLHHGDQRVFSI